ncbi:hypothetical protein RhiirA4_502976 [Rhizophagus irregularis]|uniref:Crinkler family protein n=1 Tax=Rhizophagus irregularis TaxID=588596 RepID=A0A2I1H7Y5_9GLOM|nr:hypothetical protein RhiirA4_502976 [Rhizophagus irregularis]
MSIKLKPLCVCKANEQFPLTNPLTEKPDDKIIDWQSGGVIVINGSSAPFDVFFVREPEHIDDYKFLMMNQCGSKKMPVSKVEEEDEKNLKNFFYDDNNDYMPITIIFTSQPYIKKKQESGELSGVLVVSKEDFKKHFGSVFSSRASFAFTGDTNSNFWEKNRLENVLDGICYSSIGSVIKKWPYYSDDDYYNKNPGAKKIRKNGSFLI